MIISCRLYISHYTYLKLTADKGTYQYRVLLISQLLATVSRHPLPGLFAGELNIAPADAIVKECSRRTRVGGRGSLVVVWSGVGGTRA